MPYLTYSIAQITAWTGSTPTLGDGVAFEDLRLPDLTAESRVESVEAPGLPYHGLRIREKRSEAITAAAVLHCPTVAYGLSTLAALRALKPVANAPYYGVWLQKASVNYGPYDLLSVQIARWRYVLNPVGVNIPGAAFRHEFVMQLKERERPT